MGKERQRERLAALALTMVVILTPISHGSAAVAEGPSSLYIRSEDTAKPEFNSLVGADEDEQTVPSEGSGAITPKPEEPKAPGSETPREPIDDSADEALENPAPSEGSDEVEPEDIPTESTPPVAPTPPTVPPSEEPKQPVQEVLPVFATGPGAYELSKVSWNQMSAKQVCVDVAVRGTGAPVQNWYLTMNAATVPLNHDFNRDSYQIPTWGYGFEGNFEGGKIKVTGSKFSQWNDFSTLTKGQERTLRICNWNTPKPPSTHEVQLTELSSRTGAWSWSSSYRVSAPEAQFYTSWKVRVDVSKLNSGYRGSSPIHSTPGPADLKITQISGDIYEVEGIGWPNMGVRSDHSIEFTLGR